jgi:hypothetical protein
VHPRLGSFLPPAPTPSLTTHSTPSLSVPPPQYPAETILPLSLILLKREYRLKNYKKGFKGDYGVKLTPNRLKAHCEVK